MRDLSFFMREVHLEMEGDFDVWWVEACRTHPWMSLEICEGCDMKVGRGLGGSGVERVGALGGADKNEDKDKDKSSVCGTG